MNLSLSQSTGLLKVMTGKEVTVVHPFCKKSKSKSNTQDSIKRDLSSAGSIDILAVCNTVFDFKTTSFTFVPAEENFKKYSFSDALRVNLFAERFYIPPRV
tara:strand:- start:34 stop:336 length:303 start_codon:yes stop_codon:yes gene_type:complete